MYKNWLTSIVNRRPGAHAPGTLKRPASAGPPARIARVKAGINIKLMTTWLMKYEITRERWPLNSS